MTYADPVAATRAYLDSRALSDGDPVRAFGGVPNPRPSRFIRLIHVGTTVLSVCHRDVRLVAECWESSEERAAKLGDIASSWLEEMDTDGGTVPQGPDGWVGGPYSQPDPDSRTPRSVMTFVLRQGAQ